MKGVGVDSFGEMLETAQELGVKLYACSTSMEAMGMSRDQLVDGVDILGAAAFLNIAADCKVQLFIG
jgi:peroxiredoxin family protein